MSRYINNSITTDNGTCFKDYEAFKNNPDDVCYVSEYGLEDIEELEQSMGDTTDKHLVENGVAFTRNSLKTEVLAYFGSEEAVNEVLVLEEMDSIDEFVECMFNELDWQYPSTWLNEYDY